MDPVTGYLLRLHAHLQQSGRRRAAAAAAAAALEAAGESDDEAAVVESISVCLACVLSVLVHQLAKRRPAGMRPR